MRILSIVLAAGLVLVAGCFTPDGDESTAPPPDEGLPTGGQGGTTVGGGDSVGCTGNGSVGAGNGDIGSDRSCDVNATTGAGSI